MALNPFIPTDIVESATAKHEKALFRYGLRGRSARLVRGAKKNHPVPPFRGGHFHRNGFSPSYFSPSTPTKKRKK